MASSAGGQRAAGPHPGVSAAGTARPLIGARRARASGASVAVLAVLAVVTAVAAVAAWQVYVGQRLPDGPVRVAWEKEACGHCHMHLSEMGFAVQLQATDGSVVNFDDPGCFFGFLAEARPELHEVWFHHSRQDRWLRRGEVGFVAAASTPMNFGLAAVDRNEAGAISYEAARDRIVARREGRG